MPLTVLPFAAGAGAGGVDAGFADEVVACADEEEAAGVVAAGADASPGGGVSVPASIANDWF